MRIELERRALQVAVMLACSVPLLAGGAGMAMGADFVRGVDGGPADLDSHFRYLSGLLAGIGIGFLSCIPRIEDRTARFRLLTLIVLIGGAGRAVSAIETGLPGLEHRIALGLELGVTPLLMLWQRRVARRWRQRGAGCAP